MINSISNSYGMYRPNSDNTYIYNKQTSKISSVNQSNNSSNTYSNKLSTESSSFLKGYNAVYKELYSVTEKLNIYNKDSMWNKLSAQSSNDKAVSVQTNFKPSGEGTYSVDVQQIAKAQENVSNTFDSSQLSNLGAETLTINKNGKNYTVNYNGEGKTNKEALTDIAKAINAQNAGLKASVIEKDKKSYLKIEGTQTGERQNFEISGTGNFESLGISNISQQSQDAIYTIKKDGSNQDAVTRTSSNNKIDIDSYRVSADIKGTGSASITISTNKENIVSGIKDMVEKYNKTVKFMNDNEAKGTAVGKHLYNLLVPPTSEKSMNTVGIEYKKDGTMTFNEDTFSKAYEKDPQNVKNIVSGSYGVSEGLKRDAIKALGEPSVNLLDNTMVNKNENVKPNVINNYDTNSAKFFNTYARSGAYNMINYGVLGMMMNLQA